MTSNRRITYAELLRRARDQSLLTLAATNAVIERRETNGARAAVLDELVEIEAEIDALIAEQESQTLASIDSALRTLRETPELFGICVECGEPISAERLRIAPWSDRCDEHAGDLPTQ